MGYTFLSMKCYITYTYCKRNERGSVNERDGM